VGGEFLRFFAAGATNRFSVVASLVRVFLETDFILSLLKLLITS